MHFLYQDLIFFPVCAILSEPDGLLGLYFHPLLTLVGRCRKKDHLNVSIYYKAANLSMLFFEENSWSKLKDCLLLTAANDFSPFASAFACTLNAV